MMSIHRSQVDAFEAFLREERAQMFGLQANEILPDASSELRADTVFDPEKAEATCPACGTLFSTQLTECPDCGLGFAVG